MEILQFLLNFFLENNNNEELKPFINLLKENDYDIKKVMQNFSLEKAMPKVMEFFKKNNTPTQNVFESGLKPISNIADKEIVYTLNRYFGNLSD